MKVIHDKNRDLFTCPQSEKDAVVVTTNGMVKKDGKAVMGAGIAKSARDAFYNIDTELGMKLKASGNHAYAMGTRTYHDTKRMTVLTMPTKHDWRNDSDINLIRRSASELAALADELDLKTVYMPAPGCTNGHLDFEHDVRPCLEPILDDRFVIIIS